MATPKYFSLGSGKKLTSEIATNLYLYSQITTPTGDDLLKSELIRPELQNIPNNENYIVNLSPSDLTLVDLTVDAIPYMSSGPGRFANGSQFDLVRAFFLLDRGEMLTESGQRNLVENVDLAPGTYTKKQINEKLFGDKLENYSSAIELRNYRDIYNFDYDELVYIWNSSAFSLPNNVEFIVNPDKSRYIKNFSIEPNAFPDLKSKENFDFATANPVIEIGSQLLLESRVDPSKIGRTVFINFDNRPNLLLYDPVSNGYNVYNVQDFAKDLEKETSTYHPESIDVIPAVLREADKLFNAGVTQFLYQNKPIAYGTVGSDYLFGASLTNPLQYPTLREFADNGVVLLGGKGADTLDGGTKNDILMGHEGNDKLFEPGVFVSNDRLEGGTGNDTLDGGKGKDVAVFSDEFKNYDISPPSGGIFGSERTIAHNRGTQTDGTDTFKNIEFGIFRGVEQNLKTIAALPLEDGSPNSTSSSNLFAGTNINDLNKFGFLSETLPVSMLDRDAEYTVGFSAIPLDTQYNVAFIIDTSASMDATELQQAKNAYINLANHFINNGLADVSNFAVISFSRNATSYANLTATQAISTIQGLTTANPIEGTQYNDALWKGVQFFTQSPLKGVTNLAYFASDGKSTAYPIYDAFGNVVGYDPSYVYDAVNLRNVANVQAFGLYDSSDPGTVSTSQLDFVDSDNAVILSNAPGSTAASQLQASLGKSGLTSYIDKIEILKDGNVAKTISPAELTDSPLGLSYEGEIDGLNVDLNAQNQITAKAYFTNGTAPATLNSIVESGLEESTSDPLTNIAAGTTGNDEIIISQIDKGADGGAGDDKIIGNRYDNNLDGGDGKDKITAYEGNDTIIPGNGIDRVDGGDGIDTAVYADKQFTTNIVRKVGNAIAVNNEDTLVNTEFIQFSDVRIDTNTLQVVPILTSPDVTITEGDSGTKTAQFTFNLSSAASANVQFSYTTVDVTALAGSDYVAQAGQVTIPVGQTSATINVTINGDTIFEPNEEFGLTLSGISGATFKDNATEYNVAAKIENDDPVNYTPWGLGIPNTVVTTNAPNRSINLAEVFLDIEDSASNTALTYSIQNNTNSALFDAVTIDQANGILLLDYKANTTGVSDLTVRATDSGGLFVDTTFTVWAIAATSNNDTITGGDGNDYLDGLLGNDSISGLSGDDTLTGGAGIDTLIGGAGNDAYLVDTTTDTITENAEEGIDTVSTSVTYTLGATSNLENLTLTGSSTINGTGNDLDNVLLGNSANNNLSGGSGDDTMSGGAGIDTLIGGQGYDVYNVDTITDTITENANEGTDTVITSVTYGLGANSNLENLTLTGTSTINGTGNAFNNVIEGNNANNTLSSGSGSDTLTGGDGVDTLIGANGNDFYLVDTVTDTITENANEGYDTVTSSVTYTLGANIENLNLIDSTAINGTGNTLNNIRPLAKVI
jgi:Ca2+-binding RTX toxin-like protein